MGMNRTNIEIAFPHVSVHRNYDKNDLFLGVHVAGRATPSQPEPEPISTAP